MQRSLLYPRGGPVQATGGRRRPCRFRGRRSRHDRTANASSAGGSRREPGKASDLISTATAARSGDRRFRVAALTTDGRGAPDRELSRLFRLDRPADGGGSERSTRARLTTCVARRLRTVPHRRSTANPSARGLRCALQPSGPSPGHPRRALHIDRRCCARTLLVRPGGMADADQFRRSTSSAGQGAAPCPCTATSDRIIPFALRRAPLRPRPGAEALPAPRRSRATPASSKAAGLRPSRTHSSRCRSRRAFRKLPEPDRPPSRQTGHDHDHAADGIPADRETVVDLIQASTVFEADSHRGPKRERARRPPTTTSCCSASAKRDGRIILAEADGRGGCRDGLLDRRGCRLCHATTCAATAPSPTSWSRRMARQGRRAHARSKRPSG